MDTPSRAAGVPTVEKGFLIYIATPPSSSSNNTHTAVILLEEERSAHTMGRKRASLAAGSTSGTIEKTKKAKKRRRESDPVGDASTSSGQEKERSSHSSSSSSSKKVVLRCAPEGAVSPIVVSFANQTVPEDMGVLQFAVHAGEDEDRAGQRVVMGEGSRCAKLYHNTIELCMYSLM